MPHSSESKKELGRILDAFRDFIVQEVPINKSDFMKAEIYGNMLHKIYVWLSYEIDSTTAEEIWNQAHKVGIALVVNEGKEYLGFTLSSLH